MVIIEDKKDDELIKVVQNEKSEAKNFFNIFSEDGSISRQGFNILLNTGRKINTSKILGLPLTILAGESSIGQEFTVTDCNKVVLGGFSLYGGELINLDALPMPAYPLSTDLPIVSEALIFGGTKALNDIQGQYDSTGKIKLHVLTDINPVIVYDTSSPPLLYAKNNLILNKDEITDSYFNTCVVWIKIDLSEDATVAEDVAYVPYTKFAFAPIHNQNGQFETTIEYGIYL